MPFICTRCHAPLEPEYRFCAQCGHAIYDTGRSTLWIHLGWAALSTLAVSAMGGALWLKQTPSAQLTRTVIVNAAQHAVGDEIGSDVSDVLSLEQLSIEDEPSKTVVVSAADIKPYRWKAAKVDVGSAENIAQQWGVNRDFLIQPIELTEGLVAALSGEKKSLQRPQELSVRELQGIADQLSLIDGFSPCYSNSISGCNGWRIPEMGEWMVAAHAGQYTHYSGSDRLGDVAGPEENVGSYAPNALGVYDMSGSALEWVSTGSGFGVIGDSKPLSQQSVLSIGQLDKRIKGVGGRLVRSL